MSNNNLHNQNNHNDDGENHPYILKLFSKAKETGLSSEERSVGSLLLKDFMEENARKTFYTEYYKNLFVRNPQLVYGLAIFILIFGITTGAVYGSQDSIPGEILYPIKRQVTERVERVVALGAEAKAKVAVKQAATRIEEVKTLIEKNKIDSKTEAVLQVEFDHTSKEVEKNILKLEKEGRIDTAIKISSEFEETLSKREKDLTKSLEKIPTELKEKLPNTESLREYIKNRINVSASMRVDLEKKLMKMRDTENNPEKNEVDDRANKNTLNKSSSSTEGKAPSTTPIKSATTTTNSTASTSVKSTGTTSVPVPVSTTPIVVPKTIPSLQNPLPFN